MNSQSTFYKTKATQMDKFVVQEIKLSNKFYKGLRAVAKAENISIEELISSYLVEKRSIFDHPNYPKPETK